MFVPLYPDGASKTKMKWKITNTKPGRLDRVTLQSTDKGGQYFYNLLIVFHLRECEGPSLDYRLKSAKCVDSG